MRRQDGIVVSCSALRRVYRDRIVNAARRPVLFVHLDGPRALLAERLKSRKGHFFPPSLLDSQLAALEPPEENEPAIRLSVTEPIDQIVDRSVVALACNQLADRSRGVSSATSGSANDSRRRGRLGGPLSALIARKETERRSGAAPGQPGEES